MDIFEESRLFKNFSDISKIPRGSGNEKAVSDYIAGRAGDLGLEVIQDNLSNLIIKKPATSGYESKGPVMLQAHMDMVCEKRSDSTHDFDKDPIQLVVDGDRLRANGTTLGADNGIGVAMAMSILESDSVQHPPLEVVLTVEEETSFSGASEVDKTSLKATRMINLDHACETELITGSCGGMGVNFELPIERISEIPEGLSPYKLSIKGLTGGHSGEDIHKGRANAILLALRLAEKLGLPVTEIEGGSSRTAIPREASVTLLSDNFELVKTIAEEAEDVFRTEYSSERALSVNADISDCTSAPIDEKSFEKLKLCLRAYPNGIVRMFDTMPGVVESSDNIGIIETYKDRIKIVSEIRGAYPSTIDDILKTIRSIAGITGAGTETFDSYAPWSSRSKSPLRDVAAETYENMYGCKMTAVAVHAGLECSFFAAANPDMDIIAIGPDCENFHSPEESVSISSSLRVYDFLENLLSKL